MSYQASLVPPRDACATAEDVQFYRTVLHELIELGVALARDVCSQAKAEPGLALPDAAVMFERVSRAVRRTVALAQRLGESAAQAAPRSASAEAARRMARRRILRQVEDAIQLEADRPGQRDCLRSELYERMDAPELDEELDMRPAAEIVADICRDLGVATIAGVQPWPRRTPADIVALCARAARPADAANDRSRTGYHPTGVDAADPGERFFQRDWRDGGSG